MIQKRLFVLLACLSAFAPLAIDLYLPSFAAIGQALNSPIERVQSTVTLFLIGFSAGMLLYGPVSDRLGRRRVILAGVAVFTVASVGCAWAHSLEQLLVWRVLQAVGGGAAAVVARAAVRDLFDERQGAKALAMIALTTSVAPLLAPLLGAALLQLGGWRANFVALALFGLFTGLGTWAMLPESLKPQNTSASLRSAFIAYGQVLTHRDSVLALLCGASLFAAMFAYITGTPFVYMVFFGLSERTYALLFGLNIVGLMGLSALSSAVVQKTGTLTLIRAGACLVAVSACLVLWATHSGHKGAHELWVLVCGLLLGVGALGLMAPNTLARLLALHPQRAGAASAVYGSLQFGLGALASGLTTTLHNGTSQPMGWVFAGMAGVCVAAVCGLKNTDGSESVKVKS